MISDGCDVTLTSLLVLDVMTSLPSSKFYAHNHLSLQCIGVLYMNVSHSWSSLPCHPAVIQHHSVQFRSYIHVHTDELLSVNFCQLPPSQRQASCVGELAFCSSSQLQHNFPIYSVMIYSMEGTLFAFNSSSTWMAAVTMILASWYSV